jgi:starch phosphorylase
MKKNSQLQSTKEGIVDSIFYHLRYTRVKLANYYNRKDIYSCLAKAVMDRVIERMLSTEERYRREQSKHIYYLSMEFLIGRTLGNNIINMNLYDHCAAALEEIGEDLEILREIERDAALGNGGLGRLAACFLDSMASLDLPGGGYGLNYEFGLFRQTIVNGYQQEKPDDWRPLESPWLVKREDRQVLVPVYGRVLATADRSGSYNPMWMEWNLLVGMPYDMPIVGYGGHTVNHLRLFSAISSSDFDMAIFNDGDYLEAVRQKIDSENISKILYPKDSFAQGQELRLLQEYFLVACSIRDIVRRFQENNTDLRALPEKVAIQINDTHPALSVAELMRMLVDEKDLPWDEAWDITTRTCAVTNHTLLPEALETWPVDLINHVIPRHLQIIYEINHRFLEEVNIRLPGDQAALEKLSIIAEGEQKRVRMINLAVVGSHAVNGVARLHTELIKSSLLPDFYRMWPEKFNNKTNGVTPRRWLLKANPLLAQTISSRIGEGWITDLNQLKKLEEFRKEKKFLQQLQEIKLHNKQRLEKVILQETNIDIDTHSMFDVHIKRFHEYKRQMLNILRIIYDYLRIVEHGYVPPVTRTCIFAGKAAPGYHLAKLHIKLIHSLSEIINSNPLVSQYLKVVFLPDYRVSLAEKIIPAADLSEQISTAGLEASGTSNMKFAINGALTIGTYDGANIEIAESVGEENIFIFGLRDEEISRMRNGGYNPRDYYDRSEPVRMVMNALSDDRFCPENPGLFMDIYRSLIDHGDRFFLLADFESYLNTHREIEKVYANQELWAEKCLYNIARMGWCSSDRTIMEYAKDIWNIRATQPEGEK